MSSKGYRGQPVAQKIENHPPTDFDLAKSKNSTQSETKALGVERSRSAINLKDARRKLKKMQDPYRKV